MPTKEQFKEWIKKDEFEEYISDRFIDAIYSFFSSHNDRVVEEIECSINISSNLRDSYSVGTYERSEFEGQIDAYSYSLSLIQPKE